MKTARYGSWSSPVTAARLAQGQIRLSEVRASGERLFWLEGRPAEGGRSVVVERSPDGRVRDRVPEGMNARTLVHEYGGGAYRPVGDAIVFANFDDQRLYRQQGDAPPEPITPEPEAPRALRYADLEPSSDGTRLYCVRERHEKGREALNELVVLPSDGSAAPRVVFSGPDFVSFPRLSPDGRRIAFTSWHHPHMPWDATELWVAEVRRDGALENARVIAGGADESIFQPEWSPTGALHFVSDRSGWWNLYRFGEDEAHPLAPLYAEFAGPQWVFAMSTYGFLPDGRIACAFRAGGVEHLGLIEEAGGRGVTDLPLPFESFSSGRVEPFERGGHAHVALVAASPTEAPAIVRVDVAAGKAERLYESSSDRLDPEWISPAEPIEFPTTGNRRAHAFFYAPKSPDYEGPKGERPPLVVMSHGGPTASASSSLNPAVQFWTTRGFAVVDVNYGGSTGYGREYRERLQGSWGIVDTEDCIHAARHLAGRGLVDPARMAIRGGSAGGYTTLCALTFHDVFAAGASYYGVADAEALARDTHKFESRYLDSLIGPYPEARERYRERSPVHAADRLACPLLILQGLEDEIVPPSQAEILLEALRKRAVPHAYLPFEGEQHGFRRAENIVRALEAELYFYGRVFGFEPADPIDPVRIENEDHLGRRS